jgi:hypothetical protein
MFYEKLLEKGANAEKSVAQISERFNSKRKFRPGACLGI